MTARRAIAAILILVASVLAPFAIGARWAERTITDADRFSATVAPLASDPLLQQAISTSVSGEIIDALDVQSRLDEVGFLPEVLSDSVAAGVNSAIANGVRTFVSSDQFAQLWSTVALEVQRQLVATLERDGTGAVRLDDGRIVLDPAILADLIREQLDARGDLPFVGEFDPQLATDEIVLTEAPNLQIVADALRIFMPVARWLWIVVLAMFVAGILLWRPRARGSMWAGLGLFLGGLATWIGLNVGSASVASSAADANMEALTESLVGTLVVDLVNALLVVMAVGVVLIVGGWLAGGTRSGRRVRDAVAVRAHGWGGPWADSGLGRFTSDHPMLVPTLRGLVLVGALAALLLNDRLMPSSVLWTGVVAAALLLIIEVVEGAGLGREARHAGAVVATHVETDTRS